ncbi:MAG: GspH/FimT family pseudopilin [Myxococcales bacterium]|nr:GspH/FimT family pseudopilin [Myxococcales bacterium]
MTPRNQAGFTAAEILVVVAIIGILAAVAIPSMSTMLATQAVRSAAYDLNADLVYARSEAISRGTSVTITGASTTDFKKGWTIATATDTLRTQPERTSKLAFTASNATYTFDRTGRVTVGAPATFTIVATGATQDYQKRCVKLDPSGRPRSNEGVCA